MVVYIHWFNGVPAFKGAIDVVYLNEFKLVSNMFSFKAAVPQNAIAWIEGIQKTQVMYTSICLASKNLIVIAILFSTKMQP